MKGLARVLELKHLNGDLYLEVVCEKKVDKDLGSGTLISIDIDEYYCEFFHVSNTKDIIFYKSDPINLSVFNLFTSKTLEFVIDKISNNLEIGGKYLYISSGNKPYVAIQLTRLGAKVVEWGTPN